MAKLTDTIILGDLIVTGKTHLKDDLTIDEQVSSDFIPDVDNSYDLGSAVKRFANVYATAVIVDGVITSVTSTTSNTMTLGNSTNATSATMVADGNSFQLNVNSNLVFDVISGNTEMDFHKDVRVRGSTPTIIMRPASDSQQGRINYEDTAGNLHGSIQYEPAGDYLRYYSSTTSSEWWRFDSSGMTITNELEVGGNIISRGTGTQQLLVESTDGGLTQLYLRSNTRDWYIKNTEGVNDLIFDIDGTDAFWMDGTNTRFGVGTDPSATIHAKSSSAEIRLQDTGVIDSVIATYSVYDNNSTLIGYFGYGSSSNSDMTIFNNQAGDIAFYTAGVERFRIDNSLNHVLQGSLGVGDNSYSVGNLTGKGIVLSNNDGTSTGRILLDVENISSGYNTRIAQNDTGFIFESESNSRPFIFYTGSPLAEVVRIDIAGLDVTGNINVTSGDIFIGGNRVLTVNDEGSGGGIDADTLDGLTSSQFLRSDASDITTGVITMSEAIFTEADPYLSVNNNTKHLVLSGGTGWTSTAGTIVLRGVSAGVNSGGVELRGGDTGTRQLQISGFTSHTIDGNTIWHAGNDGVGSGLDADLLDGVAGADYVLGNGTNNGAVTITVDDVDFVVRDTTDSVTNYIWRDHSASKLYIGSSDAVVTLRSGLEADDNDIYDVNRLQVGNATSSVDANYTAYIYQTEDQNEDVHKMALYSRININGDVSNFTADKIRAAVYGYSYLNDNSTTANSHVSQPVGLYGYAGAVKGHADTMYGVLGLSVASGGADTDVANVYGGSFEARIDNPSTTAGTIIGVMGSVRTVSDADDSVTANSVRGYINADGSTIGTARYFYGNADVEVGATITTLYGLHVDMQNSMDGTLTNRRGIWVEAATSYNLNSFGGRSYFGNAEGWAEPDSPWIVHVEKSDATDTLMLLLQGSASGSYATFTRGTAYSWDVGIRGDSDFEFRDNADVTRLKIHYDALPIDFDNNGMLINSTAAIHGYDSWLRLNPGNAFTSGVYFNTSQVRTDGYFRAGAQSSTFYPEILTLNNATANRHRLQIRGGGSSFTTADILLEDDSGQAVRGMGMFMYNRNSGNEWFFGQPYNGSELEAGIYYSYQNNGSEGGETSSEDNYIVEFNSSGQTLHQNGTSSLPGISFKSNPDCGFRLSASEIIVGSDGNNVMGWSAGNINIYNNAVLNIDGTSKIDFDDRVSADPGTSTLMSLGGVPIMKQVSDRGAIVFASKDDTLILGCGDVGNDFEAQIGSETSENTWIVSDGSVYLQSGLQNGYNTSNQVIFNGSGDLSVGGNLVWHAGNDGAGSGLDADLLDGYHANTSRSTLSAVIRDSGGNVFVDDITASRGDDTGVIYLGDGGDRYLYFNGTNYILNGANLLCNGGTVWHSANDGAGTGLDADLLDGNHASAFALSSHTHGAASVNAGTYPSGLFRYLTSLSSITGTATDTGLSVFSNSGTGTDAIMSFHVSGDYAVYFGLDGGINDLVVGGWSMGAVSNRIWHAGNDGSGSGLDADTLDSYQASDFPRKSEAATITGGWTFDTNISIASGHYINHNSTASRDKIRVWNSSTYSIGMDNAMSFGNLNDYAMTFQMNNDGDRGFWWGHSGHTDAQGAMSLTTHGELTVDRRITINGSSTGFNPASNTTAALQLNGAFGGGIVFNDTNAAKIWVQSSGNEMHFTTGNGTSYDMKIDNSGNFTASGNVTAYSDETLKDVKGLLDRPELLENLEVFDFYWKDGRGSSIGPLAQRVQKDAPELINTDIDTGILSLDYGKYAVALAYEEKKKREQAETEINKLREEVDELKDLVRQLLENKNSE